VTAGSAAPPRARASELPASPEEEGDARRIAAWLAGRLVVATILLGGHLLSTSRGTSSFSSVGVSWLIGATYAATLLSAVVLQRVARGQGAPARTARRFAWLGAAQIVLDLGLEATLVWLGGGVTSAFTFLFGVTILAAAVLIGPGAARGGAVGAITLYVFLSVATASGWLPVPPDQDKARYVLGEAANGFALLRSVVGLSAISVLANYLAARQRRTRRALARAAESVEALERLNESIVLSLTAGLLTLDEAGLIRTANPAACALLAASAAELTGCSVDDFFSPLTDEVAPASRAETIARRRDQTTFPAGYTRTSLHDASGRRLGGLLVFQDLSEVHMLRESAAHAERLAQLGRIAAGLAHEIRNPLGSISGSVQLVSESPELAEEDRKLLGIVIAEADRLDELVATMLQLGRPSAPLRDEQDLNLIVRDVVEMARVETSRAGTARVAIEIQEQPIRITVDGAQIRQVVWNLLKNALQATPAGGTVTVAACRSDDGAGMLEVRDEGAGVSRESLPQLFEVFYTQRARGTGLGLALVKQIVDAHGARIDAEPRGLATPGHPGTTFRVTFPPR
jgi:two-component system sensor histidine kinase PilS (NtrC family)